LIASVSPGRLGVQSGLRSAGAVTAGVRATYRTASGRAFVSHLQRQGHWARTTTVRRMKLVGSILSGCGAASAIWSAVLVLLIRPNDFRETYDGGELPRLVKAQRWPTVLALLAGALGLAGTVVLALA
jgi:hypothetical protein